MQNCGKINLITRKDSNPYVQKNTKKSPSMQNTVPITIQQSNSNYLIWIIFVWKKIPAKTEIEENSPFDELHFENQSHRTVVRKTSLCWLLRKDWQKVSDDRLRQVQCSKTKSIKLTSKYESKLRLNKRKKCYIQKMNTIFVCSQSILFTLFLLIIIIIIDSLEWRPDAKNKQTNKKNCKQRIHINCIFFFNMTCRFLHDWISFF